ncbi:hypothetical protein NERG_00458 [Nematocida ausubeli]|uniref:Uncharacterized protein n=1 Tax=Nematocida ausubeli (strain ATCC PRA-371 / ERTm2) TaxID=1913371 RepID=H8ZA37_NEMA1|nr:hypothetical protein NERG_00458 [Nematocida ausubeli]
MQSNLINAGEDGFSCVNAAGVKGKCCYSCIAYLSIIIFAIAALITFVCVYPPAKENKKIRNANISKLENVSETNKQSENVADTMRRKMLNNQEVDLYNWDGRTRPD